MLRSNNKLKAFGLGVGGFAAALLGVVWIRTLATADPFARLRAAPSLTPQVGIRLDDVDLWHYSGSNLRAKAHVARVDVRQDRQYLDLYGVDDGVYYTDKGSFRFTAAKADWSSARRLIEADQGARVYGGRFDLAVTRFDVDQASSTLRVPGTISGQLYGGKVQAMNLEYHLDSDDFSVGPALWEGTLAIPRQDGDAQAKPTHWRIKTDGVMTQVGEIQKWPEGEATDGDVLVKADMVERDTKTDVITATGNVRYFSAKSDMTCDKAVIYRKEKRAVLTSSVHLLFKPEDQQDQPLMVVDLPPFRPMVPDEIASERPQAPPVGSDDKRLDDELRTPESVKKYPVSAIAAKVEYWYGKGARHAIITGNPQARQELPGGRWRHLWSPSGYYDGEKETLKLVSAEGKRDTRMRDSLGQDITCDWFEISTKDGDEDCSASKISGDLVPDDEDLPKPDAKKPKPGPGAPPAKKGPIPTPPAPASSPVGPSPSP